MAVAAVQQSDNQECREKPAPNHTQESHRVDLATLGIYQSQKLEVALLAWAVVLYHQNHCVDTRFSWGLYDNDNSEPSSPETFDTSILCFEASTTVSEALGRLQAHLQQSRYGRLNEGPTTVFLNDEVAPDSICSTPQMNGQSTSWGNTELRVKMTHEYFQLQPVWHEPLGAAYLANHIANSWIEVLKLMPTSSSIASSMSSINHLNQSIVWQWNKDLPPTINMCLHDVIASRVEKQPHIPAVSSWDGNLTYQDVDVYSTRIANHLVRIGISIGDIISLYFHKSKWTMVAILAVMKAGGAFVLIEPSYPSQRKEIIVSQVQAKLVLTSKDLGASLKDFAPNTQILIIDEETVSSLSVSVDTTTKLPVVPPNSLLYIIFTSGSTGMPKGVKINHATYTTSVLARSTPIGYSNDSRVLDFTSYAFDVSIDSMLCTLVRGGCLCIPSDDDRVNDLSHAIREFRVNMINITPSVARILDPDIIPSLRSLGIGGEACSVRDVHLWGQHTRVVVGYGPSECTIGCTVNPNAAGKPYISIGPGTGAVIWLVDPADHNTLSPIGAVGELLVEGPLVGQGYLNDAEKTSAAFINDPPWLLAGGGDVPGRKGVLYKTGDLVRYDPDGQCGFIFVGRKDTQIKLRGQRIELSEIEHHIKLFLPGTDVVADIVSRRARAKDSMIVAFIADLEAKSLENTDNSTDSGTVQAVEMSPRLAGLVNSMKEKLSEVLPSYMLPTKYISVNKIPMLVSGKTDRKSLKGLGEEIVSGNKQ